MWSVKRGTSHGPVDGAAFTRPHYKCVRSHQKVMWINSRSSHLDYVSQGPSVQPPYLQSLVSFLLDELFIYQCPNSYLWRQQLSYVIAKSPFNQFFICIPWMQFVCQCVGNSKINQSLHK